MKRILFLLVAVIISGIFVGESHGQAARKSVTSREVNGTYRMAFTGKYKGVNNEIKILALGGGKVKIGFELTYPFFDASGNMSANIGQSVVIGAISGDTATYLLNEAESECSVKIRFVRPGEIKVENNETLACGWGHNVSADGTYKKVSSTKPKFVEY